LGEAVRLEGLILNIQAQLDTLLTQLKVRSGQLTEPVLAAEVAEVVKPSETVERSGRKS